LAGDAQPIIRTVVRIAAAAKTAARRKNSSKPPRARIVGHLRGHVTAEARAGAMNLYGGMMRVEEKTSAAKPGPSRSEKSRPRDAFWQQTVGGGLACLARTCFAASLALRIFVHHVR
jgi:hypothetical protein